MQHLSFWCRHTVGALALSILLLSLGFVVPEPVAIAKSKWNLANVMRLLDSSPDPAPPSSPPVFTQTNLPASVPSHWLQLCREPKLLEAMLLLQQSEAGKASLGLIERQRMRVVFRDLKVFGEAIDGFSALAWMSKRGEVVLLVHERHRNAPPAALAALLAHEAMHGDSQNSRKEEAMAWSREASVWRELRRHSAWQSLAKDGLVDRLNRLVIAQDAAQLDGMVISNPAYASLPDTSPGFE